MVLVGVGLDGVIGFYDGSDAPEGVEPGWKGVEVCVHELVGACVNKCPIFLPLLRNILKRVHTS